MKRDNSLKGTTAFKEVYRRGRRYSNEELQLIVLQHKYGTHGKFEKCKSSSHIRNIRIGISITKKFGNAVVRNRAKRRLKSICREFLPAIQEGFHIILRPKEVFKDIDYVSSRKTVKHLLGQAGVLKR